MTLKMNRLIIIVNLLIFRQFHLFLSIAVSYGTSTRPVA